MSATQDMPLRQGTTSSTFSSNDAVPEVDPTTTAGLLSERLQAWKHAVGYLEDYISATEKIHKSQAKEYEKVLKTVSQPVKEGRHFDQGLGGVAGFFENMRVNTQAMVNSNAETEKTLKGTVLPILERLHKEIKAKVKEIAHGAEKGAKSIEKSRNETQKQIELLGQHTASFESTGGRFNPIEDPYIIQRNVTYKLNQQVIEENNHRNDLIHVQEGFQSFEAHVIGVIQQAMEAFNAVSGGQAEKTRALYADMLGAVQRIPPDFEWQGFLHREAQNIVDPNEPPRSLESITFPNQNHASTKPLIEGSLERKSRNKLAWGTQTGYYVVTPSKYLHEFKDSDSLRNEPKPELSIYLPEATIGMPAGEKFTVKGKDKGKSISSKLSGTAELSFKAHTTADAQKWFEAMKTASGTAAGPAYESAPGSPVIGANSPGGTSASSGGHAAAVAAAHKEQEAGITGDDKVTSPTLMSPVSPVSAKSGAPATGSAGTTFSDTKAAAPVEAQHVVSPTSTEGSHTVSTTEKEKETLA